MILRRQRVAGVYILELGHRADVAGPQLRNRHLLFSLHQLQFSNALFSPSISSSWESPPCSKKRSIRVSSPSATFSIGFSRHSSASLLYSLGISVVSNFPEASLA